MAGSIHRFFTNVICGFIYNKDTRKRARVIMNSPMLSYIHFIHKNLNKPLHKIKTFIGYQARNLLISANNEYIFKFPLRRSNSSELAIREKRIVDAFAPISPVYVPPVEILQHRGALVRKYKFIRGTTLRQIPTEILDKHTTKLAKQIARFIYKIASSDPESIRDLKPTPDAKPGYMYGWTQGDICDNFIVDLKTMKIVAFIDWEDSAFGDFSRFFNTDHKKLMTVVKREYDKLFYKK